MIGLFLRQSPAFALCAAVMAFALIVPVTSSAAAASERATGKVNCEQVQAQPYFPCPFEVVRKGPGAATVSVTFPDGTVRKIVYRDGQAESTNSSEVMKVEKIEDLVVVHVGTESFEIVDTVPFGG